MDNDFLLEQRLNLTLLDLTDCTVCTISEDWGSLWSWSSVMVMSDLLLKHAVSSRPITIDWAIWPIRTV